MKCPCRFCEKRKMACHDSCPEYKEWHEERMKIKKADFEENRLRCELIQRIMDTNKRNRLKRFRAKV